MLYKQKLGYVIQTEKRKRKKMDIEAEIKSRVRIEETEHSKVRKKLREENSASKYITYIDNRCDVSLHN